MVDTFNFTPIEEGNSEQGMPEAIHIKLDGGKSRSRAKYVGTASTEITLTWLVKDTEYTDFLEFYNEHQAVSFYLEIKGVVRTVKFITALNSTVEGQVRFITATLEMEAL